MSVNRLVLSKSPGFGLFMKVKDPVSDRRNKAPDLAVMTELESLTKHAKMLESRCSALIAKLTIEKEKTAQLEKKLSECLVEKDDLIEREKSAWEVVDKLTHKIEDQMQEIDNFSLQVSRQTEHILKLQQEKEGAMVMKRISDDRESLASDLEFAILEKERLHVEMVKLMKMYEKESQENYVNQTKLLESSEEHNLLHLKPSV